MTLKTQKKTVIQWLDEVRYADDNNYKPSAFALMFVNFIKLVNDGMGEENVTPVLHYKMLDALISPDARIANMVFRGAAKTTLFGEYLILYLATFGVLPNFGEVNLAIYLSDSMDNGVKNMRKNLEYRWDSSDFLKKYVPDAKFTDARWEFRNSSGKRFIVKGYGAKTGVRGVKELGQRPQLAIIDDVVSDEDARSQTVINSIEDTIYKAVEYALHPKKSKIIWSGTPFNAGDPLYKAVEAGSWRVNVFPVCEKFPCAEEEFKGAWPDRFTYEIILQKYENALKDGKIADFNQELMLRIMSDSDRLIHPNDLRWYSRHQLLKNKASYNFYITSDIATTEKQAGDYTCICVWAVNYQGQWFLVDIKMERQNINVTLDDIFRFAVQYNPQSVGIEVSGQQGGFVSFIESEMLKKNIFFHLASTNNSGLPGIRPTSDKFNRFQNTVPMFKQNRYYLPIELKSTPALVEATTQLSQVTAGGIKAKNDDFIDNVSMTSMIDVWYPNAPIEYKSDDNVWSEADDTVSSSSSYFV